MTGREIREAYPFLYETHLHTMEASACAGSSGAEMAKACHEAGYTGIFVTDHNWGGNTAVGKRLGWQEFMERFIRGYESARKMVTRSAWMYFSAGKRGMRGRNS